ncbi:MAG: acylphosphatase [Sphingomicrobium sp.]
MARIAKSVRVTGFVQGVFFRAWTKEQAEALGVSGWVRNCHDGSVEALVAGEEAAVEAMIERMRRGPPGANVEQLTEEPVEVSAGEGFAIRH